MAKYGIRTATFYLEFLLKAHEFSSKIDVFCQKLNEIKREVQNCPVIIDSPQKVCPYFS